MHRYATAPRSTFEQLFEQARAGVIELAAADYPPVCASGSGEVSLALGRTGAMIVHVHPGECRAEEFRLKLLFETGTCVFSNPEELYNLWTGPLAAAFGIVPAKSATGRAAPPAAEAPGVEADASAARPECILADLAPGQDGSAAESAAESAPAQTTQLTTTQLVEQLARVIHGQDAALERVASACVAQLTKRHPARPGSVLLIGPTGVGKTSTVEALPTALKALGLDGVSVFRLDCGELTDSIHLTRLLGSPPGYSGHASTTPLLSALERPGCVLLVDELEKAHPDVHDLLLGLLDAGRVTSPTGQVVDARHVVVALTTSVASEALLELLGRTPLEDRWAVQRACTEHLRAVGLPDDLIGRIGAFAVYAEVDDDAARRGVAEAAITALGREYGLVVEHVDPVVIEVAEDIARDSGHAGGVRALQHAARELLAESFAALAADGPPTRVTIDAGPPLAVCLAGPDRAETSNGAPGRG